MMQLESQATYCRNECAIFLKTVERFGGLSNMAGGYPLFVNGIHIPTTEALYQACRFPHKSDLQKIIIGQKSPMTAKMKSKPYRKDSRPDWDNVRVEIMWWCLRVKLAQHWENFGDLLLSTNDKLIVEESYRDQFWGAKPINSETLVGSNILGQLLTNLREQLKSTGSDRLQVVEPLTLSQFLLIDKPIGVIEGTIRKSNPSTAHTSSKQTFYELFTHEEAIVSSTGSNIEEAQNSQHSLTGPIEAFASDASILGEKTFSQLTFDFIKALPPNYQIP